MSQIPKTRTMLIIGAFIRAAATLATVTLSPLRKLSTLAGLAGQVLRLFRGRKEMPPAANPPPFRQPASPAPGRLRQGSGQEDRTVSVSAQRRRKGGSHHG